MARAPGTATPYPGVWRIDQRKYRVRAYPVDPKTGRAREVDRIVHAENAAHASRLRAEILESAKAVSAPSSRLRFGEYATSWLRTKLPSLKVSTRKRYENSLVAHLVPAFGDQYLDAITREDVTAWRDRQGGKPGTINGHLRVLRSIMRMAAEELEIRNPTVHVAMLRDVRAEEDHHVLAAGDLRALLDELRKRAPTWYPLFLTMAMTGARFGEVSALRWSDIDTEAGVIIIRRAQWSGHEDTTKTGSMRRVPILPELVTTLEEARRAQIAEQARRDSRRARQGQQAIDRTLLDRGIVFPSRTGGFRSRHSLRKPLEEAAAAAKLPRRPTGHWLRHTLSDLLRQASTSQVQRSMTGHVTEAMAEHYSHVSIEERRSAVSRALRLVTTTGTGDSTGDPTTTQEKAG